MPKKGTGRGSKSPYIPLCQRGNHDPIARRSALRAAVLKREGAVVASVDAAGPAAAAGLQGKDRILAIDGKLITDALDASYHLSEPQVRLTIQRGQKNFQTSLRRKPGQTWGGRLEPPKVRPCGNRCLFCFVDQMPPGMRPSLYVKDEDYRHSFLFGNYVTLSHISSQDLKRIKRLRLSPLYVSVHATNERIRQKLLGIRNSRPILPILREAAAARIEIHAQAVICPGINDGKNLARTVQDLAKLYPTVRSLALVPVGLTKHRGTLYPLRRQTADEARRLLADLEIWQRAYLAKLGSRFVYATDEWYLKAGQALPAAEAYEGYPQIENGVGLIRQFLDGLAAACGHLPAVVRPARRVLVPAGELPAPMLKRALRPLTRIRGLDLQVITVPNRLFGRSVGVSGLLCGQDLVAALAGKIKGMTRVLIAADMLRQGQKVFLDDMTLRDFSRRLGAPVRVIHNPRQLLRAVLSF